MNLISKKAIWLLSAGAIFMTLSGTEVFGQRRPAGGGGAKKPANVNKPSNAGAKRDNAPRVANSNNNRNANAGAKRDNTPKPGNNNNNNRNVNAGNKNNVGNKVNIDNSKRNVNVNIDNSKNIKINNTRNTSVRRVNNYRPYPRPPYRYGGFSYYCYRPYFYHPYRPFVWGPVWHPWGFFVATLATTAIIISIADSDVQPPDMYQTGILLAANDNSFQPAYGWGMTGPKYTPYETPYVSYDYASFAEDYYYDEGVYYIKGDGGYTVVAAPVGATIKSLPKGYETVKLDDGSVNYYYGGAFYEKTSKGYTVVPPTAGTFVEHISDGGEEVTIGEVKYVKIGDTYYQPVQEGGKNGYEVASVEDDK